VLTISSRIWFLSPGISIYRPARADELIVRPRSASDYDRGVDVPEQHREFARRAQQSLDVDPGPTLASLSRQTGVPVEVLKHFALVRWVSAGAEALLSIEPQVLEELVEARRSGDWTKVAGIIDWLDAGR
jgi:hypothetical protein